MELLGLKSSPPEYMIMKYIPIAPLTARPNIHAMGGVTRDQLSDEYRSLLAAISQQAHTQRDREDSRRVISKKFEGIVKSSGADTDAVA